MSAAEIKSVNARLALPTTSKDLVEFNAFTVARARIAGALYDLEMACQVLQKIA